MNAFQGTGRAAPAWTRAAGAPARARLKSAGRQCRGRRSHPGWEFLRRIRQSGSPVSADLTSL
jgi:hypothetical protein